MLKFTLLVLEWSINHPFHVMWIVIGLFMPVVLYILRDEDKYAVYSDSESSNKGNTVSRVRKKGDRRKAQSHKKRKTKA